MSDFTTTEESYTTSYDDVTTTASESDVSYEQPITYGSNFLSSPMNRIRSDESADDAEEDESEDAIKMGCAKHQEKKEVVDTPSVVPLKKMPNLVHISTKIDKLDVDITPLKKMPNLVPIATKIAEKPYHLVSVDTLAKADYEALCAKQRPLSTPIKTTDTTSTMGDLMPLEPDNSDEDLIPLSSLSTDELTRLTSNSSAMGDLHPLDTKTSHGFKASVDLVPLSSLSDDELAQLSTKSRVMGDLRPLDTKPSQSFKANANLIPLSSLSVDELERLATRHTNSVKTSTMASRNVARVKTTDELVPWTSLSAKEKELITLRHQTRRLALSSVVSSSSHSEHEKDTAKAIDLSAVGDGDCDPVDLMGSGTCSQYDLAGRKKGNILVDIDDLTPEQIRVLEHKRRHHHHKHDRFNHDDDSHIHKQRHNKGRYVRDEEERSFKSTSQTNKLVDIDELSSEKIASLFAPYGANQSRRGDDDHLVDFETLPKEKQDSVVRNMDKHLAMNSLTEEKKVPQNMDRHLVNINSLPREKQEAILQNIANTSTSFENTSDTLSEKRIHEALNASRFSSSTTSRLYNGLPLSSANLSCPNNVLPADGICGDKMMTHIGKTYPMFAELITRAGMRDMFNSLLHNHDIGYLIIVPNRATLNAIGRQANTQIAYSIAVFMLLLHKGEDIPVSANMYSCLTPVDGVRTVVRRKDDATLEIENTVDASVDPNSVGRVYRMAEQPTIEDLEEEDFVDTEEEDTNTTSTTTTMRKQRKPQLAIMDKMPGNEAEELKLKKVEEQVVEISSSRDITLNTLHQNYLYKNRHMETLCQKMMSPVYSGAIDMANFVDYGVKATTLSLNNNATTTTSSVMPLNNKTKLSLKIYGFEDLYKKYQANTLHAEETEKLGLSNAYEIESATMQYNLDKTLSVNELTIPASLQIKKSELINRFCVLSFPHPNDDTKYALATFSMPDDSKANKATGVFMSSDESVLLRFHANLLTGVALNTDISKYASYPVAKALVLRNGILALDAHRHHSHIKYPMPANIQGISVGVNFDKDAFARLYTKELTYGAFVNTVMPLGLPSFIRKVQALGRNLFSKVHKLKVRDLYDLNAFTWQKNYSLVPVLLGIGGGSLDLAKNLHTHQFRVQKGEKKDGSFKVVRYKYFGAKAEQLKFGAFGSTSFQSKTLSITLKNPATGKDQNFLFQLDDIKSAGKTRTYETSRKITNSDQMVFIFDVVEEGKLMNIYIEYAPRNVFAIKGPRVNRFEKAIINFLAAEANAYKTLKMESAPVNYMEQRLRAFAKQCNPSTYDKAKSLAFFEDLSTEVQNLLPTTRDISTTTSVSSESQEKMIATSYLVPNETDSRAYHSLFTSGFKVSKPGATLATLINSSTSEEALSAEPYNANRVLNAVIEQYDGVSKNIANPLFTHYMTRVQCILNSMISVLKK